MKDWVKDAVVYQIYPKSFQDSNGDGIGDLKGIINRLDYLEYLGINVIWLCPIYKSGGVDGGYDIANYKEIEEQFGTLDDFDELLDKAHKKKIKVIMDLVVNHTSDKHPYFIESRSNKTNSKKDWYIWRDAKDDGSAPSEIESVFSGSAWEFDENRQQYYLHLFAKGQPDLNWKNDEVRKDIYSMISWWMDKNIDGFRMDVISVISKDEKLLENGGSFENFANGPQMNTYLKELNKKVLSKYNVMTVGEAPGISIEEAKNMVNEDENELDMIFNFDHIGLEENEYGKWNTLRFKMKDFRAVLAKWQYGLEDKGWNSLFMGNHDQPRAVSRFGDDSTPLFWEKSAKMLATSIYLLKGTPYIFQGEEIGMTNVFLKSIDECKDIESINAYDDFVNKKKIYTANQMMQVIRAKGRDNARTPFQWNDKENAGFTDGTPWIKLNPNYKQINVEQQKKDNNSILQYYRKLINLRKTNEIFRDGKFSLLLENNDDIFAYSRILDNKKAIIVCNYSNKEISLPASLLEEIKSLKIELSNYDDNLDNTLKAYESRVYLF